MTLQTYLFGVGFEKNPSGTVMFNITIEDKLRVANSMYCTMEY